MTEHNEASLPCEWCGTAVSQAATRTPRRYCKQSHRQRAYESRRVQQRMQGAAEVALQAVGWPR